MGSADVDVTALAAVLGAALPTASVLLAGSAARGELAQGVVAGRHEVFSDYEFFVATAGYVTLRQRQQIGADVRRLAATFGYRNPLFHVDVGFRERWRLRSMPRTVFTLELKRNGRHLSGADVRALLPAVEVSSFDVPAVNEMVLYDIEKMLHDIPAGFVRARGAAADELEELTVSCVIARAGLGLATVLLSRQGILPPTFRERVAQIDEQPVEAWAAADRAAFRQFLHRCLDERCSLTFSAAAAARYPEGLRHIHRTCDLIGLRDADDAVSPFHEWPMSRGGWWVLARSLARIARAHGAAAARRWAALPRKAMQASGQLAMHDALAAHLRGDDDAAGASMRRAWQMLVLLVPGTPPTLPPPSFPEQWLAARARWQEQWQRYCLLVQP